MKKLGIHPNRLDLPRNVCFGTDSRHILFWKTLTINWDCKRATSLPPHLISDEFDFSLTMIDLEHSINTGFHQKYHRWRLTFEINSLLCQDPGFYSSCSLTKNVQLIFPLFVPGHGVAPRCSMLYPVAPCCNILQ